MLTQRQLLLRFYPLLSHLLDLTCKHDFRLGCAVDTVGLDRHNDTTTGLQEQVGVQADNSGLVRLSNIGEDDINHADQHSVSQGVSGVFNNGDDVGAVGSHADQITARSVREFNSVDSSSRTNDISDVTDGCTASSTKVEHLGTGTHVDIIQTTKDTGSQLGTEGVPHTVFGLVVSWDLAVDGRAGGLDRDALFAINSLSGGQVLGDKQILLSTASDKDAGVTVRFLKDNGLVSETHRPMWPVSKSPCRGGGEIVISGDSQ
jgi:hypothetical protein